MDFKLDGDLELSLDFFRSTFMRMSHLFRGGPFGMVFEHLWDILASKILPVASFSFNKFPCDHGSHSRRPITCVLGVIKLLALSKLLNGIKLIAMGEVFYRLVKRALCVQLCDAFFFHLSPHQFGVAIMGECEVMVHNI